MPHLAEGALAAPRLLIAACGTGTGWRRAALALSTDDGVRWEPAGATAAPAVIGVVEDPGGPAEAAMIDRRNAIVIVLAHDGMTLADADDAGLDAGLNLALIGDELVQFGEAEPLGAGRWRLSRLWRGRRGTEAATGTAAVGDRFVLRDAAALAVRDAVAGIGASLTVLATGSGDGEGIEAQAELTGASVLPPAPVHVRAEPLAGGGALLRWARRSRTGWRWQDGTDAPLGEESERYRVRIIPAAGAELVETVTAAELSVPPEVLALAPLAVELRQMGDHGLSPPAFLTL